MIEASRSDAVDAVRHVLRQQAKARATLAVPTGDDHGLFPPASALTPSVRPVVVDANWLRDDILRVCRSDRATVLITCATEAFLRPFAAPHVMLEVEEHAREWSSQAGVPVELFLRVWTQIHGSLLRVAEPDLRLLTEAERYRIEVLRSVDADDVPTAALAISLQAPLVSTDSHAVTAVYGSQQADRGRDRLLSLLAEGGTSAQLGQMSAAAATATGLVGMGVVSLGKLTVRWPVGALLAAGAMAAGYIVRDRWWNPVAAVAREVGQLAGAVAVVGREASEVLAAETPLVASWAEMVGQLPRRDAVARAVVCGLARCGRGHLSAHELAGRLPLAFGGVSETTVRSQLRSLAPGLVTEVCRGRWQVGRPGSAPTYS